MTSFYVVPKWFYGVDVALEIAFALITMFVAIVAFKMFKITDEEQFEFFGVSFGFISFAYFLWAIINLFVVSQLTNGLRGLTLYELHFFRFLLAHYGLEYRKKPTHSKFLVFIAFLLLFISHAGFLLSGQHYVFYVLGHLFNLTAYIIILVNLILVLKHAQKKK